MCRNGSGLMVACVVSDPINSQWAAKLTVMTPSLHCLFDLHFIELLHSRHCTLPLFVQPFRTSTYVGISDSIPLSESDNYTLNTEGKRKSEQYLKWFS